jgi:hypothetical protein
VEISAPERAEAVGHFAEDDAGASAHSDALLVGGTSRGDEGEELSPPALGLAQQFGTGRSGRPA